MSFKKAFIECRNLEYSLNEIFTVTLIVNTHFTCWLRDRIEFKSDSTGILTFILALGSKCYLEDAITTSSDTSSIFSIEVKHISKVGSAMNKRLINALNSGCLDYKYSISF